MTFPNTDGVLCLAEVSDISLGISNCVIPKASRLRVASRVIALDENGRMPLMYSSVHKYHKLAGGGVDPDETLLQAAQRELLEEAGCTAKLNPVPIGKVVEYRAVYEMVQISVAFFGEITAKGKETALEAGELDIGLAHKWVTLDEAIALLESDNPEDYEGKFIVKRDLTLLTAARRGIMQS